MCLCSDGRLWSLIPQRCMLLKPVVINFASVNMQEKATCFVLGSYGSRGLGGVVVILVRCGVILLLEDKAQFRELLAF